MIKLMMIGKMYKVKKEDNLTPSDEKKLVDLSHSTLVYVTKEYDSSVENWCDEMLKEELEFKHTLPKEVIEEFDFIETIESKIKEEEND